MAQSIHLFFLAGAMLAAPVLSPFTGIQAAAQTAPAGATLRVAINIGHVIDLPSAASAIVVGNPTIANANLLDSRRVLLTGHNVGVTNLIIFDQAGRRAFEGLVEVGGLGSGEVNLFRGATRLLLNCAGTCESVATVAAPPPAGIANSAATGGAPPATQAAGAAGP